MTDPSFFVPKNARPDGRHEYLSDFGRYKLVVTPYETTAGCSNYSQGLVFRLGVDEPIAEVLRNHSAFPHAFIEHPNGHHYLICGEDYQGQTVIELDTGNRRDYLPSEAAQGHGFCWAGYRFDSESRLLVVDGCFWACPYEYRFYDFSDPIRRGWPQLEFEGAYAEGKWPVISSDGLIRCYELEPEDEDTEEEVPIDHRGWACIRTYRRHGNELRFVSTWVSETEGRRRRARAEGNRMFEEWRANFKAKDPLYREFLLQVLDPSLSPEEHEGGVGITYQHWCPTFAKVERRWTRRIITRSRSGFTVDLDWGVDTGPIKITFFPDDNSKHSAKFFEHSVEGMREAFAYARSLLTPTPMQRFTRPWCP